MAVDWQTKTPVPFRLKFSAFTLVEVVIAISITAVLMVALWSLLTMYLNVSARSERQTMRVQLVRSIQQYIEHDLRRVHFQPAGDEKLPLEESLTLSDVPVSGGSFDSSVDDGGTLDFGEGDNPRFASSFDRVESTEDMLAVDGELIHNLINEQWAQPGVVMKGNSLCLVLEHPFRSEPNRGSQPSQEMTGDFRYPNPPTEVLARTIYVFVDRAESLTKGFPPGLLRVQLLPNELERIRNDQSTDLFQIVEQAKPRLFKKTEYTDAWHEDESLDRDARAAALDELNRSLGRVHLMDHDFVNRIDYLPEVSSFRFRFFDGDSWSDSWDAVAKKSLPLSVELSFDIDMDLRAKIDEDFARLSDDFTYEDLLAEELAGSDESANGFDAMGLDDEVRSAQTVAFVPPNQFLIHLGVSGRLHSDVEPGEPVSVDNPMESTEPTEVSDTSEDEP